MFRWRVLVVAALFLVLLSPPVLAQGGEGGRVTFGQDITIANGERVDGDLVAFGGSITVESGGTVRGNAVSFGGDISVAGRMDGDVISLGGHVNLRDGALVSGNVLATSGVERSAGAIVRGQVGSMDGGINLPFWPSRPTIVAPSRPAWSFWPWGSNVLDLFGSAWRSFLGTLTILALGVIVVLLVPGPTRTAGQALVAYPGQSVAVGLLTWLVAILALPLLVIICVGIPVAIVGVAALAIAATLGWVVAGLTLGDRLLEALNQAERQPVLAVAVGLIALAVLTAIPCLGTLAAILVSTWGLGAVVLTRFGTAPYAPVPAAAAPLPPTLPYTAPTAPPAAPAPTAPAEPPAPAAEPPAPAEPGSAE